MDIDQERSEASRNIEKLVSSIPADLSRREDAIEKKLTKSKASVKNKLKVLYEFMGEIYSYASKYTACKKGCSHCCSYGVTISELEILHIEEHTKNKRNKVYLTKRNFHGTECTFLKNGKCTIYLSLIHI